MHIIPPHTKPSRPVSPSDYTNVIHEAAEMVDIVTKPNGIYPSGYALAHAQVSEDPLAFFVTNSGSIIMNPKIVRQTKVPVMLREGCLSYADRQPIDVPRSHKCEVEFELLNPITRKAIPQTENMSGLKAQIFQHEIGHILGQCIYETAATGA